MTIHETRKDAAAAEARARALAARIHARAAASGANADAKTWSECATLIIEHAEAMAVLVPKEEAEAHFRKYMQEGEAVNALARAGKIPVEAALASLERIIEQGDALWEAQLRLRAWQEAVLQLMRCRR